MPRLPDSALPQFVSGGDVRTDFRRLPEVSGVSLRAVGAAAQDAENTFYAVSRAEAIQAERELAIAQRRREKLAHDEASSAVHNTVSQGRAMWTEELLKAKSAAPSDVAGFTDGILKRFDSWAETAAGGVPELAKPLLKDRLGELRSQLNIHAFEYEMKARGAAIVAEYNKGAEADALTLLADPTQITPLLAQRMALARTLNVPPEDRATMEEGVRHKLAYAAAQGLLRAPDGPDQVLARLGMTGTKTDKQGNRIAPDPAKAAEAVKSDPIFSNMSPDHVRMIADQATMAVAQREAQKQADAERRARAAEVEAARRSRAADQAWNILSSSLLAGHQIDPSSPTNKAAVAALQGTPYAAAYREMLADSSKRAAAALQPLDVQESQLQSLYSQRNSKGTSPELDAEIKRREGVLAAAKREYADEPLLAATRRGVIQAPVPVTLANVDTLTQTIGARVQQADSVRTQAGRSVSPLTSAEAGQLSQMMANVAPAQFGTEVAKLASVIPPHQMTALASQMNDKDRPLALALAAGAGRTTMGVTVAQRIREGQQALRDKAIKEDDHPESGLRATLSKKLGGALSGAARDAVIDSARLIYLGQKANGVSTDEDHALRLAVGGEIVQHNGASIPVPAGVGLSGLRDRLQAYPRQEIERQAVDGWVMSSSGRPVGVPEFLAELPRATLEAAGFGRYYVHSGAGIAMGRNGQPLTIEIR